MNSLHKTLFEKGLITEKQEQYLDAVESRKLFSVHFELRTILYLGILLFTGGIGYIAYENIGEIGHYVMMFSLLLLIVAGVYFLQQKALPFAKQKVKVDLIYFDYLVVLVSLLIVGLFTYVQVYFELLEMLLQWSSLITAILFFYMAYRFDSVAVLSMAIAALAAVFGLTISPVNWVQGYWAGGADLYVSGVTFGLFCYGLGWLSRLKEIKSHFSFTYKNFALLLAYFSILGLLFESDLRVVIGIIAAITTVFISYITWMRKEFLFFLYSSIMSYILISFLISYALVEVDNEAVMLLFYYFPFSTIGLIILLVKHKNHFSNE